ncbi:hypothetical protein RB601_005495 [Gaeumannomyces tritici]
MQEVALERGTGLSKQIREAVGKLEQESRTRRNIRADQLATKEAPMAKLPNLRRLFIEARTDNEEREVSRRAFYNAVLFMGSVAVFSLIAQRMNATR